MSACNGSDNNDDGDFGVPPPAVLLTGVLLNSPVIDLVHDNPIGKPMANIDYTNATGTHTGVTNAAGEYEYLVNETLFFSIGDLGFPPVNAKAILTPVHMARTFDINSSNITNIERLLMTLDKDANPENGITITDTAKATATQVDFSLTGEEFVKSDAVTNLIFNGGQDDVVPGLVSTEEAVSYFESLLNLIPQKDDEIIEQYLTDNGLEAVRDDSGMYYHITAAGTGEFPEPTAIIEVRYKGSFIDGVIFDQTTGDSTRTFNSVIPGWRIALSLLKPGGKGNFYFPSALGYGQQGSGSIPPNTVLFFEIELVSFENKTP